MADPILQVRFYCTGSGKEPVREWLKELPADQRRAIGEDIKTAQFGWPLGMPLIRNWIATFGKFAQALPLALRELFLRSKVNESCCFMAS